MFLKKIFNFFSSFSIRLRLSLIFILIFGSTTIIFNAFVFKTMIDTLQQDFDDALFNYSVDVSQGIELGPKGDLSVPPLRLDHGKILPFPLGTALIQVKHSSGATLARVGNFGDFDPDYKKDFEKIWAGEAGEAGEEAIFRTIENDLKIPSAEADTYRLISFPIDNSIKPQILLQIAVPMTLLETQIQQRLNLLQVGIPLVFLIAALGGSFLSARALNPIKSMIQTTKEINAGEMSQRVPIPEANDEIKKLAQTLNEMLDRIQQAFQSQERFIADASHQLLTPLAIMKGELELFKKTESQDISQLIKSELQEIDNLAGIVQEMLLLARVDAGKGALNLQDIYLDEMVFEAFSRCEKLAKSKNIKLKFNIHNETQEDRKKIRGDNDLLQNLVMNIIENAIKYSPKDETVSVSLNWTSEHSQLIVEDNGSGIPEDQLPFIFDRFSRGSHIDARVKGFGLGLAIAQKIAQLHKGHLIAENKPEHGAKFTFEIKNI